jgi:Antibiotic biosynthesis monooxygenase
MPVILYAEFTAKPGVEPQVETLISGLAEKVRQEPGNTEFTVYRERDNPRKFFVLSNIWMRLASKPTSVLNTASSSTSSSAISLKKASHSSPGSPDSTHPDRRSPACSSMA